MLRRHLLVAALLYSVGAEDTLDNADQTCTSINGVVKCGGEEGTEWIVQFGSHRNDELRALAIDASTERVYCAGSTMGAVGGEHRGYGDVWMAGISHAGEHEWSTQIGTNREDNVEGLAAGDGHVVGGGWTYGHWGEEGLAGTMDGWRGRWDDKGRGQWGRHHDDGGEGVLQAGSEKKDSILGVASDAWLSIFFAAGQTYGHVDDHHDENDYDDHYHRHFGMGDAWLGAFSGDDGRHLWTRQIGSEKSDTVAAVASTASGSAVFACGQTFGEVADGSFIGKGDVWVTKHDGKTGEELWVKQIGSERAEEPTSMASTGPGDAVYVAGSTFGAAIVDGSGSEDPASAPGKPGGRDGFVAKLDGRTGRIMWSVVLGTNRVDFLNAVAVSPDGESVYVGGQTYGDFNKTIAGKSDAWIAELDAFDGSRRWVAQFGELGRDDLNALVVAPDGDVVAGGATDSDFGACSSGLMDVWVARVAPEKAHAFFSQLDHEHAATHDCPGANKEGGVTRKNG